VVDILAARASQPARSETVRHTKSPAQIRPQPTIAREPAHWSVPLSIGWLPALVVCLGIGVVDVLAAWHWVLDAYGAGLVAARLVSGTASARPLPEGVSLGQTSWWRTTSAHLAEWAAYLDRAPGAVTAEDARALLDQILQASPTNPAARIALARSGAEDRVPALARALAQPRDIVALTWTAQRLFQEGKREAARSTYRASLELAAHASIDWSHPPVFLDDSQVRRYALPTEELISPIVRAMASEPEWVYADWADLVPKRSAAPLAVARLLRELARPEAEAALATSLAEDLTPAAGRGSDSALRLAAAAEALALQGKWNEALERYRQAIECMPHDLIRRSWWLNVADLALRVNEPSTRLLALELAKITDPKDEVTQRAVELQKATGVASERTLAPMSTHPGPKPEGKL
jgi:hypothetical protein